MNKITSLICSIIGIVLGYVSFILTKITGIPALNVLLLIFVIFLTKNILQRLLQEKRSWNWWFSNGLTLLIILWLGFWTILFNL
ncbi:MAG: hypothetical protein QXQ40_00175 [Candidatus Aenigmatarchaeota archaeon]